jgi:hypothetical protein
MSDYCEHCKRLALDPIHYDRGYLGWHWFKSHFGMW